MKFMLRVILVLLISTFIISGCKYDTHENESKNLTTQKIIHVFLKNKSKNMNDDDYSSSTYKPGNPLYQPVLYIQRNRWDLAKPLLEKLVKKNDPDAMYWLANISGGSAFSGRIMADLFKRSARLGNPYSALRLSPESDNCSNYLRDYCNEKWKKIAIRLLSEKKKKGDIKAKYYLNLINDERYDNDYVHNIIANAKNGYLYPLYNYVNYNREIKKNDRKEVYKYMIDKNFSKVADLMLNNYVHGIEDMGGEFYRDSFKKLEKYGDINNRVFSFYSIYLKNNFSRKGLKDLIKSRFYQSLVKNTPSFKKSIINKKYIEYGFDDFVRYNNDLFIESDDIKKISKKETEEMKNQVVDELKNSKPVVYIDEYFYKP
ncbi:hypothetical protein [Vibrio palustris]|nr:hypothetical protein [Vibrio palustris]